jgi:hypothetical protein
MSKFWAVGKDFGWSNPNFELEPDFSTPLGMLLVLINVQGTSSYATYIPVLLSSNPKQAMPLGRQRDRKAPQVERHSRRWAIIAAEWQIDEPRKSPNCSL